MTLDGTSFQVSSAADDGVVSSDTRLDSCSEAPECSAATLAARFNAATSSEPLLPTSSAFGMPRRRPPVMCTVAGHSATWSSARMGGFASMSTSSAKRALDAGPTSLISVRPHSPDTPANQRLKLRGAAAA
jgi:hypothetical protein